MTSSSSSNDSTSLVLSRLSSQQRRLLQMSIHINPMIVAHADGNYSFRESTAFAESVRTLIQEPAYRSLVPIAGTDPITEPALNVMLETHSKDVEGYLQQVAELLERLPAEAADAYRRFTVYAIVKVAEASRDGLFGLVGDRVSTSEKRVMKRMAEVLELPVDEETRSTLGM